MACYCWKFEQEVLAPQHALEIFSARGPQLFKQGWLPCKLESSTETNNKAVTEMKTASQQLKPSDNQSTMCIIYLPVSSRKKQAFTLYMSQEKFVNYFKD